MEIFVLLVVPLFFYSKVFVIIIMEVYVIHSHNNWISLVFLANWQAILLNSHWHGSNTHTYFHTLTHHLHLLQDYFDIIKKLMDLSTIQSKLEDGVYHSPWQFINDVWLMFENFWLYNNTCKVHKVCTKVCGVVKNFSMEYLGVILSLNCIPN